MKGKIIDSYRVGRLPKPQFLNTFVLTVFDIAPSKEKSRAAIRNGEIRVNGMVVDQDSKVKQGDTITRHPRVKKRDESHSKPKSAVYEAELEVLFEDDYLAIVNKPGGMPVNGNQTRTLENALSYNLKKSKEVDALDQPLPVHRLDVPTSGLVLNAKTEKAQVLLGRMFQDKTISKRYRAVVIGEIEKTEGEITSLVNRKESHTHFEVTRVVDSFSYGKISLVDLYPITGRTHQLRIHLADMGHPIIGDPLYSQGFEVNLEKGLMLCSDQLKFRHPLTGEEVLVDIPLPRKFGKYVEREQVRIKRSKSRRRTDR